MNVRGHSANYAWQFKARFRRHAFGWRSQPAVQRVKEATREIKTVARADPVLAADGAVILLERLSPALENIDSSSGAIGIAVNNAIAELVPMGARAPAFCAGLRVLDARFPRGQGAGGNLVEQRVKAVIVVAVDQHDVTVGTS